MFVITNIILYGVEYMNSELSFLYEDDGMPLPEVGQQSSKKHEKIGTYCKIFSTSMKRSWNTRLYLDLFSGGGKCKIRDTDLVIPGSPLIALNVDDPFDQYIFCEKNEDYISALEQRQKQYFPDRKCDFVCGDINNCLEEIFEKIPNFSQSNKGLTFCFIDPFKVEDLCFDTINAIQAQIFVDFLVLIPAFMEINRNLQLYLRDEDHSIDNYLGSNLWRKKWHESQGKGISFGNFITLEFCNQMKELGFHFENLSDLWLIRGERNLALYYLAFFSKHKLGIKLWRETISCTEEQLTLWKREEY